MKKEEEGRRGGGGGRGGRRKRKIEEEAVEEGGARGRKWRHLIVHLCKYFLISLSGIFEQPSIDFNVLILAL